LLVGTRAGTRPTVEGQASVGPATPSPGGQAGRDQPAHDARSAAIASVAGEVTRLHRTGVLPRAGGAATVSVSTGAVLLGERGVLGVLDPSEGVSARLFLARGRLEHRPTGAHALVRIDTPFARVFLERARATVQVRERATHVAVAEGRARLQDAATGRTVNLEPRQSALMAAREGGASAVSVIGDRNVLLVVGRHPDGSYRPVACDRVVADRLSGLGFTVDVAIGDQPMPPLEGRALVILAASVDSQSFDWDLRSAPVPIMTWESMLYVRLGLVADTRKNSGRVVNTDSITIKDATHPLAAGLRGTVRVSRKRGDHAWGLPSPWAAFVAHSPVDPTELVLFGYDEGARLPYGVAPARRVGFFLQDDTPLHLTDDGWRLFDAAVKWSAGLPP
jgi:hypothetical protein